MIRDTCKGLLLFIVFFLSTIIELSGQTDTLVISKDYGRRSEPHIVARSGSLILNNSDSLHLISQKSFQVLADFTSNIETMDSLFQDLQRIYDLDNKANLKMIDELNTLLDQSFLLNQTLSSIGDKQLDVIIPSLSDSRSALDEAQAQLKIANENLEQSLKAKRKNGLHFALGGTAFGVILGLIIAN